MHKAPLFILASPRSFTSIVCAMLGQHPETYGVPEINLLIRDTLQELIDVSRGKKNFILHGLLRTIAQLYAGEQTMLSVRLAERWLDRRIDQSTAAVYREFCAKVSPLKICDKSPSYAKKKANLERLATTFPDAHYLYLSRHPLPQCQSMLKAPEAVAELIVADSIDYISPTPRIDPQLDWYRTQCRILEFLKTIPKPQQFRMRGEDFMSDPKSHLKIICNWLELSWSEATYEQMMHPEASVYACMGPYKTEWGNNPGFQKSPTFRHRTDKQESLEGPLPWSSDLQGFRPEIIFLAQELGYS